TGTASLTNISVAFYASDVSNGTVPVNTTTISSLAGGAKTTVSLIDPTIRNLEDGTVTYTSVVDPDNLIPETNEENNNKSSSAKPLRYNGYKGKGIYWEGESNITTKHTYDLQGNLLYSTHLILLTKLSAGLAGRKSGLQMIFRSPAVPQ
uniref:CARDB domain-containing protein n=1 Tax=Methanosarcina barkeri TaxID=2208 RepID=UPI000A941892